jgi:hypothetical protein
MSVGWSSGTAFPAVVESALFEFRELHPFDVPELYALHRHIVDSLPSPELYRRNTLEFFADHVGDQGRSLGIFHGRKMIAYALVRFPGSHVDNLGHDLRLPEHELSDVVHLEECGVHPAFRGRNLQFELTRRRIGIAAELGYRHLVTTISPKNPYSLRNHLRHNLCIGAVAEKYGGMLRLVLHRDLRIKVVSWRRITSVKLSNALDMCKPLHQGLKGYTIEWTANEGVVCFGSLLPADDARELACFDR